MSKRNCGAGSKWDNLLYKCMPWKTGSRQLTPTEFTPLVRFENTPPAGSKGDNLRKTQNLGNKHPTPTEFTPLVRSKSTPPAGSKWDSLLHNGMHPNIGNRHQTPTELTPLVQVKDTPPVFHPALWFGVLMVTLGSIVLLALWLVIYRRHTRQHTEEEPAERPLHKTDPLVTGRCDHCPLPSEASPQDEQHNTQATAPVWPGDTHDGLMGQTGEDWDEGLKCTSVQETVPLPATELGGTALVTTKTL